jgi:hypothetical protein
MAKFPNDDGTQSGITIVGGSITVWPESLGPEPTPEQIAQWTSEYVPIPEPEEFHWNTATAEQRLEELRQRLGIQD